MEKEDIYSIMGSGVLVQVESQKKAERSSPPSETYDVNSDPQHFSEAVK